MSWRMSGRLVTIPVPRGRLDGRQQSLRMAFVGTTYKSRPTMFSKTELLPLDCEPTTAIWGRSMGF